MSNPYVSALCRLEFREKVAAGQHMGGFEAVQSCWALSKSYDRPAAWVYPHVPYTLRRITETSGKKSYENGQKLECLRYSIQPAGLYR